MSQPPVVKWFTPARKIPILIGKLPSGERIWGGPYRASQAIVGGVVLTVMFATRGLWGTFAETNLFGPILTILISVAVAAAAGYGAGRLPIGSNPALEGLTAGSQVLRAPQATWCGSSIRVGSAYRVGSPRVHTDLLPAAPSSPAPQQHTARPLAQPRRIGEAVTPAMTKPERSHRGTLTLAEKLAVLMEAR